MHQKEASMAQPARSRVQVLTYLILVFLFSSCFYFLILHGGGLRSGGGVYVLCLMWCPALAGMLTLRLNGRSLSEMGWKWKAKYQFWSWLIPIIYAVIAYVIVWAFGFGGFGKADYLNAVANRAHFSGPHWISLTLGFILIGVYGLIGSLSSALGEEIGWRGFLVPELSRTFSFTATSIISGLVWSVWHYPILIYGGYNNGTPTWYDLTCFTVMVVSMSFLFAWMRLKSGSLWTGAMLHASHNLYIQGILTPITIDTGKTKWYIDEFGCMLPLVAVVFAIYFWTRRRELPAPQLEAGTPPDGSGAVARA
jgi:membrane protease YdiL (CAAX protease family)